MPAPVLQFKRGNAGVAGTVPALRPGEPAISLNNFDFFIGIDTSVANNKFFGSHRYWGREDGTNALKLKLVDKDGTNSINLKAPNTLAGVTTYTFPATPTADYYLKTSADGTLSWAAVSQSSFAGIVTFTDTTDNTLGDPNSGAIQIDGGLGVNKNVTVGAGLSVVGEVLVAGVSTFAQSITGTISTATRAQTVDTTTAPNGTFYPGLFYNSAGTASTAVYVDSGISYVSNTDTLTLTGDIAVNGGDVTTSAETFNLINQTATNVNFAGTATALNMGAATGIATINNQTLSLPNATTVNVNGENPTIAGSSTGTLTLFNTNLTSVNAFQTATDIVLAATTGITTVRNTLRVGTTGVGITQFSSSVSTGTSTSSVPTSSAVIDYVATQIGNVDLTLDLAAGTNGSGTGNVGTGQTLTFNGTNNEVDVVVSGQSVTFGLPNAVVVGTSLSAPTINTATVKHSNGTEAITIDSSGNVGVSTNLTISGNLYVNGSTTQVNTTSLTVEDRTIELGKVDGAVSPDNTTWDLGVLFNYKTSTVAKKSAVIWEHTDSRFKFASVLDADANGTDKDTPQLTITNNSGYAPIEIQALWINDCAGQSQVISCTGTTRYLENITVDAGTF